MCVKIILIFNSNKIMKKILYLAIIALGLQACLKDKEHESDLVNGLGGTPDVISFSADERLTPVNINDVKVDELPGFDLSLKPTSQTFKINVELLTKSLTSDLAVTLKSDNALVTSYNAARISEYNELKAKYDKAKTEYDAAVAAGGSPDAPILPDLYVPFEPLPVGKFTLGNAIIVKGASKGIATLTIPNAAADLLVTGNYMLPVTLEVAGLIRIANPTTLLTVSPKAFTPYPPGKFKLIGTLQREGIPAPDVINTDYTVTSLSPSSWLVPVGFFAPSVNMTMSFSGSNVVISSPPPPNTLSTAPTPPATVIFQFPALLPGNVPVVEFNVDGEVIAIRGLKYTYKNSSLPTGFLRSFEVDMVRQPL